MKTFPSLIAALLLLPLSLFFVEASLKDICKKVDQNHAGVDYNFCMTSLQVVPESHNADVQGLAIIAANLGKANVTHNLKKAKKLLNSKNVSEESKKSLVVCVEVYEMSVDAFKEAIKGIKSHDHEKTMTNFSAALTDVHTCIEAWKEGNDKSIMSKEEDDAEKVSMLALDIAAFIPSMKSMLALNFSRL